MAVGNQASVSVAGLNTQLGNAAVQIRDAAEYINQIWSFVSGLGADETEQVAALAAMPGWQDTSADPQAFWTDANYLYALSLFYYGQLPSPSQFNYDSGLALARGAS